MVLGVVLQMDASIKAGGEVACVPTDFTSAGALRERLERGLEAALATEVCLQGVDCETPETKVRGKA